MTLYFQNSKGIERIIGHPNTLEEANNIITDFLEERKFKSYYRICNMEENRIRFDVGSHTEFFFLGDLDEETKECLIKKGVM